MESKMKNMTRRKMDAQNGNHIACRESRVWMPLPPPDCEDAEDEESLQSFSSLSPAMWIEKTLN